jgi:peptidyl-prolyl cis-trans isomerase D
MGIMSFLRNRAGIIIVGAIGLAIVAFLVSDAVTMGKPFWSGDANVVGTISGEPINIVEFSAKVEQNTANFKQQMGQSALNAQMTAYVVENTWTQSISEILLNKEVQRLGLAVSKTELNDMITGKNPHPQVVQSFGNPQTGQIDRTQLSSFLSNIQTQDAASAVSQQWTAFLVSLKQERLSQKYYNLVKSSVYVTSLEAREDYVQRNKLANFNYIYLDYSTIADNKVVITDADYEEYYKQNTARFKNEQENRTFEYIAFDANPSKSDSAEVKANADRIAAELRGTKNDSLFIGINSDTKAPIAYVKKGQIDPALDTAVFSASVGTVIGPVLSNGFYKMAKVIDVRTGPDSVKASHILINPATEGGTDKARAKADSILNVIRKGTSFAVMAAQFGTDASKDKAGDLGTFGRGAMIPAFEEAVFNGKTGDMRIVTTQFGVHVIRIDKQIGSSKVVKVAIVDKALGSSNKTQQEAYTKATTFLSRVNSAKEFDAEAKKEGLAKLVAENVVAAQASIPGLESPRELVRWAYRADEGDVSDQVFTIDNKFVIGKLIDIREKGTLPLEKVKTAIEPAVRKHVKAEMLKEKFSGAFDAGAKTIAQVGLKLGKVPMPVQNIVFANPIIPGLSQENKVIGTVFGLQPGKMSKPIEGESGVYVVSLNGFSNPPALTNVFKQKEQIQQTLIQRSQGEAFNALREKADIKDNRASFF